MGKPLSGVAKYTVSKIDAASVPCLFPITINIVEENQANEVSTEY
jgi:hypothetical protein